jgi:hypothetical protein
MALGVASLVVDANSTAIPLKEVGKFPFVTALPKAARSLTAVFAPVDAIYGWSITPRVLATTSQGYPQQLGEQQHFLFVPGQ